MALAGKEELMVTEIGDRDGSDCNVNPMRSGGVYGVAGVGSTQRQYPPFACSVEHPPASLQSRADTSHAGAVRAECTTVLSTYQGGRPPCRQAASESIPACHRTPRPHRTSRADRQVMEPAARPPIGSRITPTRRKAPFNGTGTHQAAANHTMTTAVPLIPTYRRRITTSPLPF